MQIRRREALLLAVLPAFRAGAIFPITHTGYVSLVEDRAWWDPRGEAHRAAWPLRPRPQAHVATLLDWYACAR